MKVSTLLVLLLLPLLLPYIARAQSTTSRKLVWSDEFDYTGLPDSTKWTAETGGNGFGNHELEYYTAGRRENARVENGMLTIEARREPWTDPSTRKQMNYTSARLATRGKGDWKYGRVDVRAKLPAGRGTWPAIWMLGSVSPFKWPDDGEIDIMEHVGYDQGNIHGTIHCKKYNHVIHTQRGDTVVIKDCSDNFHVYSLEWSADSIVMLVDDLPYFHFANEHSGHDAWPFDDKFFLLLNVAVGGDWGGSKGVDETIWPVKMEVDYVRVYQ